MGMLDGIGNIDIAVEDFQRKYVENFDGYKYVGFEIITCEDFDLKKMVKVKVFVYTIPIINTVLRGKEILGGYWMRLNKPQMWKRVS